MAPSAQTRRSRRRVALPAAASAAALLALGARHAEAQIGTTIAPQLFGPKNVLTKYTDPNCTQRLVGQGSTQSWTRVVGASTCYEVTQGMLCTYRCIFKLVCAYDIRSGVVAREMESQECAEPAKLVKPFTPHLYWLQTKELFDGGCVPDGQGYYTSFASPLELGKWPDCSSFGEVEPGAAGGPADYDAFYTMQFYQDLECKEAYNVTDGGERPTSRFQFKLFRGAQHCYDMVDTTPRHNISGRDIGFGMENFRFVCGNTDAIGNGLMIQMYDGPKCTGRATKEMSWAEAFYPMNINDLTSLVDYGRCVRWGKFRVQFNASFNATHLPDCKDYACTKGACSGGRVKDPTDTTGTIYRSEIRSSGGDPADARTLRNATAAAPPRRAPGGVVVAAAAAASAAALAAASAASSRR